MGSSQSVCPSDAEELPTIVTSHYDEDLSWLLEWPGPVVLVDKEGAAPSPFTPDHTIPNVGREASAYVSYIARHYEGLPARVAFVHGHERAWHQLHRRPLLEVIRGANPAFGYVPLNNLFRSLDNEALTGVAEAVVVPVGAQFVVSRERIQHTSLAAWQLILASLLAPPSHPHEDYNRGIAFEVLSHTLFGEPLCMMESAVFLSHDLFTFRYTTAWWSELPLEVLKTRILPAGMPHHVFDEDVSVQREYMRLCVE
jgi:Protein of unknown function (DUF3431)